MVQLITIERKYHMKNKYKIILIICVIIGICSILVGSIAYYRIVVEGNIKASTGNAVFVLKDENSNVWNNKEINLGKVNPGDSGSFTIAMSASGSTVDMYATFNYIADASTLVDNMIATKSSTSNVVKGKQL